MNRVVLSPVALSLLAALGCGAHPDASEWSREGTLDESAFDDVQGEEVAAVQSAHSITGNRVFAWASNATADHTPLTNYSFNSKGGAMFVDRTAVGTYQVWFDGVTTQNGNPQVVAYGSSNARCQMEGMSLGPTRLTMAVACFSPTGARVDSQFLTSYDDTLRGVKSDVAYGVAVDPGQTHDSPTVITYNPADNDYAKVTWFSTGRYTMTFTHLNSSKGTVEVTPMGSDPRTCQVETFNNGGPPMNNTYVNISCYAPGGALANSMFIVKYIGQTGVNALPGEHGYAWSNNLTAASYPPPVNYSWNTVLDSAANVAGNTTTSQWVQFPSMPPVGPTRRTTVNVTAYSPYNVPIYCRPTSWSATNVNVGCTDAAGVAVKARHLTVMLNQDS